MTKGVSTLRGNSCAGCSHGRQHQHRDENSHVHSGRDHIHQDKEEEGEKDKEKMKMKMKMKEDKEKEGEEKEEDQSILTNKLVLSEVLAMMSKIQRTHTTLECSWLRQFWVQGRRHAEVV